jgi:hypothetical protein
VRPSSAANAGTYLIAADSIADTTKFYVDSAGSVGATGNISASGNISSGGSITAGNGLTVSGAVSLPSNSVAGSALANLGISTAKIANLAIDNSKIASLSVDNGKIANLAVDSTKLAANAVDSSKLGTEAVTFAKQISMINVSANSAYVVADCGSGYVALSGGSSCTTGGFGNQVMASCPCSSASCTSCSTSTTASQYWLTYCAASNASNRSMAYCMKQN